MGVGAVLSELFGQGDPARWDDDPQYRAVADTAAELLAPSAEVVAAERALAAAVRRRGETDVQVRGARRPRREKRAIGDTGVVTTVQVLDPPSAEALQTADEAARAVIAAEKRLELARSGAGAIVDAKVAVVAARDRLAKARLAVRMGDAKPETLAAAEVDLQRAERALEDAAAAPRETEVARTAVQARVEAAETEARRRTYARLAKAHQRDVEQLATLFHQASEICDRMHERWRSIEQHFPADRELKVRRPINQYRPEDGSLPMLRPLAWEDFLSTESGAMRRSRFELWLEDAREAGYTV